MPSNVKVCVGAEKDSVAEGDMVGEVMRGRYSVLAGGLKRGRKRQESNKV
jgi:hypothetical protein